MIGLLEKGFRKGKLRIFVNGKLFETFDNVEEIIPRGLYGHKETQVGVPFNISWGGGTQGLRENLVFSLYTNNRFELLHTRPRIVPTKYFKWNKSQSFNNKYSY